MADTGTSGSNNDAHSSGEYSGVLDQAVAGGIGIKKDSIAILKIDFIRTKTFDAQTFLAIFKELTELLVIYFLLGELLRNNAR
ncbi:hypothetical protein IAQ61_011898 [Plenodomus lingam]|uniref:uncharacterized protein n=1 Tax=Leptosphaeria maculans TaxID=5022 RepID=UPI00332B89BD|nr:hypothetical protein IAQ61_011898 [Plenodomus lingam]